MPSVHYDCFCLISILSHIYFHRKFMKKLGIYRFKNVVIVLTLKKPSFTLKKVIELKNICVSLPRPQPWLPAQICIWRPLPPICIWRPCSSICIYRPRPSVCVCLLFVLQLTYTNSALDSMYLLFIIWEISKLHVFEIFSQKIFSIFLIGYNCHLLFVFIS